jgi:hypothetical protein
VSSCLHSLFSLPHSSVRIIRCHRQRRRSSKECAVTSLQRSGLPFGTSGRPAPLLWTTLALLPCRDRDLDRLSRSMYPKSSDNPGWLPRALLCPATSARSACSRTHTQAPSRQVGPARPTLFPSSLTCQALRRSSIPTSYLRLSSSLVKIESSCLQSVIPSSIGQVTDIRAALGTRYSWNPS